MPAKPSPKADALRAMREAKFAERTAKPKKAKPREPESQKTKLPTRRCGYKQRSGGTGTCVREPEHQGKHQYGE